MVALVDSGHQAILEASELETSVDGLTWVRRANLITATLSDCSFGLGTVSKNAKRRVHDSPKNKAAEMFL